MDSDSSEGRLELQTALELRLKNGSLFHQRLAAMSDQRKQASQAEPLVTLERLQSVLPHGLRSAQISPVTSVQERNELIVRRIDSGN